MRFNDGPGDDADVVLLCEGLVRGEVGSPFLAAGDEERGGGQPICQVVFGQDGEGAGERGCAGGVGFCGEDVLGGGEGLGCWVGMLVIG